MKQYGWKPFLKRNHGVVLLNVLEITCPTDIICWSNKSESFKHNYGNICSNEFQTGFKIYKTYEGAVLATKYYDPKEVIILKVYYSDIMYGGIVCDTVGSSKNYPVVIAGNIYVCEPGWFNCIKRFFKGVHL